MSKILRGVIPLFCVLSISACGKRETKAAAPTPELPAPSETKTVATNSTLSLGTWKLKAVLCDGEDSPNFPASAIENDAIGSTVAIVPDGGAREWHFGTCEMNIDMHFDEIHDNYFVATDRSITCNEECGAAPVCSTVGPLTFDYPYTLHGNEMTLNLPPEVSAGFCADINQAVVFKYKK